MLGYSPSLLPFEGRRVPHLVLEVNQKCNISCSACYKDKANYTKPKELIFSEIELALKKRDIATITIAGGEPILHPDLEEIIRFISNKGIKPQLISNGFALTSEMVKKYKEAGVQEIYLHVDTFQKRSDNKGYKTEVELNAIRDKLGQMIVSHGLVCSLAITLYKKNTQELPHMIESFMKSPYVTRVLFTCCTDFSSIKNGFKEGEVLGEVFTLTEKKESSDLGDQNIDMPEVKSIFAKMGMHPFAYIGSSKSNKVEKWITYNAFTIVLPDGKFKFMHVPSSLGRLVLLKYFLTRQKGENYTFCKIMDRAKSIEHCKMAAYSTLNPLSIVKTFLFLENLKIKGAEIYYKDFTVQQLPKLTSSGEIDYCKDCPDATIRDGQLVPVCMADILKHKSLV